MAEVPFASPFSRRTNRMEKCLFLKTELELPDTLLEDMNVFREVVSAQTWNESLSAAQRQELMKLLPKFPENDAAEKEKTVGKLFAAKTFKFTNPLRTFHKKLKDGMFSPDISKYVALLKRARFKEYAHQQQVYYSNLLKEILVNRQRLLEEQMSTDPVVDQLKVSEKQKPTAVHQHETGIHCRVKRKYRKIVKEINEECGQDDTSSEDEERPPGLKGRKQLFKLASGHDAGVEPPPMSCVQGTFATKPVTANGDSAGASSAGHKAAQESSLLDITQDYFAEMIRKHRKRRTDNEEHPDLDTADITLEEILSRTHPGKRTMKASASTGTQLGGATKKKTKEHPEKRKKVKSESDAGPPPSGEDGALDDSGAEDGTAEHYGEPRQAVGKAAHFFSVIRDLISEDAENRITTIKLEERVREWQESLLAPALNDWFTLQPHWVDLVLSALKFLSGNVLGLSLDNFVPFLDYKERAQQWKWIGEGRDSDAQLAPFCQHWLDNKDDASLDPTAEAAGTPPPARCKTLYIVRSTTEEEKIVFREQEQVRFTNPHKAFTYCMHGYESVVGPVKGVYNKDSAMNKAREHALLVSDRPAFVTILTLVRDAAARLPNGEGTRSDICELLKDSQFLAPGVTDAQVNTVVSGALDRLHYEKDPCVKYDVNRKLWIYLHRSRTEQEFEKIHQAQGAAAKARKALQKPKPSKKIKETVVVQQSPSTAPATDDPPPSDTPPSAPPREAAGTTQSPKGVAGAAGAASPRTPRPQTSPKGGVKGVGATVLPGGFTVAQLQSGMRVAGPLGLLQPGGGGRAVQVGSRVGAGAAGKAGGVAFMQPMSTMLTAAAGGASKPVAFSLVQSADGSLHAAAAPAGVQPRTVLLTTAKADGQKIIATMQPGAMRAAGGPAVRFGRPAGVPVVTASPRAGAARFVQHVPAASPLQTVGAKLAGVTAQKQVATTIKIQGGMMAQAMRGKAAVGVKPVAFQRTPSAEKDPGSVGTPTAEAPVISAGGKTIGQMTMGGKPATFLLTKPAVGLSGRGKPAGPTTSMVQLLQTSSQPALGATLGATLGAARPIFIGGKPLQIGGKPYQLVGKAAGSGAGGGAQASFMAMPAAVSIVTQAGDSRPPPASQTSGASLVSQILQAGTVQQLLGPVKTVTMAAGVGRGHARMPATPAAAAVVGTTNIVVTQLPPGFTGRTATPISSQAKMVAVSQTGLLTNQILVQPSPNQAKVITPQQLFAGARMRPAFVSAQPGGKGGGLQMIKTVLSQPTSGKPAQTTILLAQPASQPAAGGKSEHPRGDGGRLKAAPVYARIIAPTAGLRFAAMRPPTPAAPRAADSMPGGAAAAKPAAKSDQAN